VLPKEFNIGIRSLLEKPRLRWQNRHFDFIFAASASLVTGPKDHCLKYPFQGM
jgi:hypothetical protein